MRTVFVVGLAIACSACKRSSPPAPAPIEKIDMHTHLSPGSLGHVLPLLEAQGIKRVVNLSGGNSSGSLQRQIAEAQQYPGRVVVFCTPDFGTVRGGPGYGDRLAIELEQLQLMGCRGLKIFKALGLQLVKQDGSLLAVDDPGLDPLFEKAGALHMPVAIHTGDPRAFWQPVTPANERYEELTVHPDWALAGKNVPGWEQLLEQFERRVARHPKTTFIGLHFGNAAEEPQRVDAMLEKNPNLFVETSARIPELGRADPVMLRRLFVRRQDRIMFGTDLAAGDRPGQLVLGSPGRALPTPLEIDRFWKATWAFFETNDRGFPHPTPIQGSWTIDGIGLPRDVLERVYRTNAERVLSGNQLHVPVVP